MLFTRLLVPLDGSESAENALAYAELIPSEAVRLLTVVSEETEPVGLFGGENEEWRAEAKAKATAYLGRAAATLARQGRTVEPVVVVGDPGDEIVAAAAGVDLIMMTSHGYGAGRRVLYGSVADHVVRHSPAPVLVVRGGERPVETAPLGRIVVPLDGSAAAETAVPLAGDLADDLGIPVLLVRALDVDLLRETVRAGATAAAAYAESLDAVRRAAGEYLHDQAKGLRARDIPTGIEVVDGPPEDELRRLTKPGDLIVMTTHGHGGFRRFLLGSVADKLVRQATAPVLLVRVGEAPAKDEPNS